MYISILIHKNVTLTLFYIFYDAQDIRGKGPFLCLRYYHFESFETPKIIILSSITQSTKTRTIQSTIFVKAFHMRPNLETLWPFKCLHKFWTRYGIVNCNKNKSQFTRSDFCINRFNIKVLRYPPHARNLRDPGLSLFYQMSTKSIKSSSSCFKALPLESSLGPKVMRGWKPFPCTRLLFPCFSIQKSK